MKSKHNLVIAITGASGSIYAQRFLQAVVDWYDHVYVIITQNGECVIRNELDIECCSDRLDTQSLLGRDFGNVEILSPHDMCAPPASGSVPHDGMVIIPCSMGTAGRIASGVSADLVSRAADVCLKERRRLVMVVRETPLNLIHLRNLTVLAEAGAVILPASPGFYSNPQTVEEMVSFVVARTMQQLGLEQSLVAEWERPPASKGDM